MNNEMEIVWNSSTPLHSTLLMLCFRLVFFHLFVNKRCHAVECFHFQTSGGRVTVEKKQSSSNSEHLNGKTQKSYVFMGPCYCCFRSHSYYCNILDTYSIMTRLLGDNCLLSLSYPTPVTSRFRISIYKI